MPVKSRRRHQLCVPILHTWHMHCLHGFVGVWSTQPQAHAHLWLGVVMAYVHASRGIYKLHVGYAILLQTGETRLGGCFGGCLD